MALIIEIDNSEIQLCIECMNIDESEQFSIVDDFISDNGVYGRIGESWIKFTTNGMFLSATPPSEIDSILPENWASHTNLNDENLLEVTRKLVVRGGQKKRKVICPPGKKAVDGRCVAMKASEKVKRKIGSKRGKNKRKAKAAMSKRKRAKSMRKRKASGL